MTDSVPPGNAPSSAPKRVPSARLLSLLAAAVALNMVVGETVARLNAPVYLDSLGTVLSAALGGPWVGAIAGVTTNVLWSIVRPTALPFAITAAVIGIAAGLWARSGGMRSVGRAGIGGLLTGLIAAVVSAPIAANAFGGVTGGGTDVVVAFFRTMGASILEAALGQSLAIDPFDKLMTFVLAAFVLGALPRRLLQRFKGSAWLLPHAGPVADRD